VSGPGDDVELELDEPEPMPDPGSNDPYCNHEWNQTAGEADEHFLAREGQQRIYCVKCGADGDA
jgi:hypothetical protein